jgi:membrane associated rhomboid family serine protease
MPDASPELSVVCRNCGSEVSPYVTECPYCGTRLRRRAPKLERQGDELRARESMRTRRRRKLAERRLGRQIDGRRGLPRIALASDRAYVTIAAILGPALLLVVMRAAGLSLIDVGVIYRPAYTDSWRYLTAPFAYDNAGYLFAVGVALALFVPTLERRLGAPAAALLLIACGSLGMLGTAALDSAFGDGITVAAGGNGIALGALAAWFALRHHDLASDPTDDFDRIALIVAAAVLLLLPVVDTYADPWAGLAGGLVGLVAGSLAARFAAAN